MVTTLGGQTPVDLLQLVDPFKSCTREQLHEVVRLAERVQVSEGEALAREGRIGREFFLILSGSVGITRTGRRVNTLGPGDFFGELAAMSPGPRNATVTALSDLDVLIIGPREFEAMAEIPGFRDALLRSMARKLRAVDARLWAALDDRGRTRGGPAGSPVDGVGALNGGRGHTERRPGWHTVRGVRSPGAAREPGMGAETADHAPAGADGLQDVPWFAACTEEQLGQVARIAERLHIQAGEVILREGRLGRELFVILEGTATVTRAGRVVNVRHAGDYFGELAAIEALPRSATVTATTDLEVLIIGPREFESMMEIPGFRNALLAGMSRRIREADDRLATYEDGGADPELQGGSWVGSGPF